ncbi:sigma-54 interaction domain-containing protein [Microaceticoccus formicicus]|uniref:sigma-54 interaction domain-containing protein n=1 Tax=Microaceticoccus formicicus TaxID=3118105 RepID=UPI003CD0376D|nr:sigma 54-interacting transcriptional regulator [Peptoniphilaceae bacterium AMB_02]
MKLVKLKPIINQLLATMSHLTKVEFAVFSSTAELITCTPMYLEKKGKNVHSESIYEVINQGNVIVNKPGEMKSCLGCRFVNNCPATIEILSCIDLKDHPIGVLSLTSFSKEGHKMIEEDIRVYSSILENITKLIVMYAEHEELYSKNDALHKAIENLVNTDQFNHIIIDYKGSIIHMDAKIEELFPTCELLYHNIETIFPIDLINWIQTTKVPKRKYFSSKTFSGMIYLSPLEVKGTIVGYSIKIEIDKENKIYEGSTYLDQILSSDKKIEDIKNKIVKISTSPSTVLITGDTGTGKELIAKAIHYTSSRLSAPFVPLNCANIPDNLFETELFGYEEGAFSGAKKGGKPGIFEVANEGTVFLDEVGELPLHLQAKLLRVLQENAIQRIGGFSIIPVNIRIIAATNRNLEDMMQEGLFREDLFYRLNVIPLHIPPLTERPIDIELLTHHFIEKYSKRLNKSILGISKECMSILKTYDWPGNIRELENAIEYAVNLEDKEIISINSIPSRVFVKKENPQEIKEIVHQTEYELLINTLDKHGWSLDGKTASAKELGISLRTLYRKLKTHGI